MTRYLLDTHAWFWLAIGDARVSSTLAAAVDSSMADGAVFLSQISPWEVALKASLGKIELNRPIDLWVRENVAGLKLLDLPIEVALEATRLPGSFHKDPADRFIVATARVHDLVLVTADSSILDYAAAGHVKVAAL